MAYWSELPQDTLELIARRLDIVHYYRFGAVCKSWQSATSSFKQYNDTLSLKFPWLVLSNHDIDTDSHSFFSFSDKKDLQLKVPGLRRKRCYGSSNGWLITADNDTSALHLLNPFSGAQIQLPPPQAFARRPDIPPDVNFIHNTALSDDPSKTDNYTVMVIFSEMRRLAFFRPKREGKWITIETRDNLFFNIIYSKAKGQFYAVDYVGGVVICNFDSHPRLQMIAPRLRPLAFANRYLVELAGELLHIIRRMSFDDFPYDAYYCGDDDEDDSVNWGWNVDVNRDGSLYHNYQIPHIVDDSNDDDDNGSPRIKDFYYQTARFLVFKLDRSKPSMWARVKSLGEYMLFLGNNCPISLSAVDLPGSKGNRIYFTDDYWEGFHNDPRGCHDLGVFNMEDGTIEPCYPSIYHCFLSPPIWIVPNTR